MNQPPQSNWWSRNWKWVVPVGCLGPLLLGSGLVFLILTAVFGALKSSEPYTQALGSAKANDEVKALLGEPIQAGFWVSGNFQVNGSSGNADFSIPISGPKGSATIYATAIKTAGRWEFTVLEVAPKGSETRIDVRSRLSPRPALVPQSQ
jgi:hypothetical protein